MSTNRMAVVQLVASEPLTGSKTGSSLQNPRDHFLVLSLELFEPRLLVDELLEVRTHERGDRHPPFRCLDSGLVVQVISYRDRDILHSPTVSQFHRHWQRGGTLGLAARAG